jgi:uncharacterized protein YbjT (DUF2867 family)
VRAKFLRKIEVLNEWADTGKIPEGCRVPRGAVDLARWEDPELGIEAWRSPNIASPRGRHADLREAFDKALGRLQDLKLGGGTQAMETLRAENTRLKAHNRALIEQVLTLTASDWNFDSGLLCEVEL